jgi:hypothetical protein
MVGRPTIHPLCAFADNYPSQAHNHSIVSFKQLCPVSGHPREPSKALTAARNSFAVKNLQRTPTESRI